MAKRNSRKRAEWQDRMSRFQASGLSVAQFCRNEGVGTHTFYYWGKRLGRKNAQVPAGKSRDVAREVNEVSSLMVHFCWGSKLQISIPAHCVDAIRCVLEHATSQIGEPGGAFRQVVVREG